MATQQGLADKSPFVPAVSSAGTWASAQPLTPTPQTQDEEDILMDSPSPLDEEEGVVMDTAPSSSSLRPTQEMVGGASTHHVQIMKASFFGKDEDLNATYSIPSPRLHTPLGGGFRREDRVPFRPASRSSSVRPSPSLSQSLLQSSLQTSLLLTTSTAAAPSPKPLLAAAREPFPPSPAWQQRDAAALDPFTRYHGNRRPLPPAPSSLQAQSAMLMAKRNLNVLVPLPAKRERSLCDHGLFLGRSFRVGWGPNWMLAHSGGQVAPPPSSSVKSAAAAAGAAHRRWGQNGLFSNVATHPTEDDRHPIRVVVEQVSVNPSPKSCDSVSGPYFQVKSRDSHVTLLL